MFSLFARLRQLILPGTAQPNDPALVMGPDLPPCMQATYVWAIFRRPPNTVTDGAAGRPWFFEAGRKTQSAGAQLVDIGWLIYDQTGVCGYRIYRRYQAQNLGGSNERIVEVVGDLGGVGLTTDNPIILSYGNAGPTAAATFLQYNNSGVNPNQCRIEVDGKSIGRGLRQWAASQNPTAAIGAEAVVATLGALTFYDGRAYRLTVDAALFGSVANVALYQVRQTNIAGAVKALAQHPCAGGGAGSEQRFHDEFTFIRTAGTDLTDTMVVTLTASAGTVTQQGTATQVRSFQIDDVGAAGDFNAANTI